VHSQVLLETSPQILQLLKMGHKLLRGGTVIAFNNATKKVQVIRGESVLIKDDRITTIAPDADIETPKDTEIIDVHGKIISPGFINTHVHMWQSVFRTIGPNITLARYLGGWLSQFGPSTAAAFKPEDVYISCLQGYMEGLSGGVTSYLDHAHNNWAPEMTRPGFCAAKDSGARVWWCYDVANRDNFPFERQWEALSDIAANIPASALVQPGISLDSLSMSFKNDTENHLKYTQQMIEYVGPCRLCLCLSMSDVNIS
jgi:cytosine/adenosine deaminase-related metal-dependent hydrolase